MNMADLSTSRLHASPAHPGDDAIAVPKIAIHFHGVSADARHLFEAVAADRRMARTTHEIFDGSLDEAIERYRDTNAPDLIVIEIGADREATLAALDRLADYCTAATRVIALGERNDIDDYRALLEQGVSDYLLVHQEPVVLIRAISRLYASAGSGKLGRVLVCAGATGGAGSSTIAQNLAASIARKQGVHAILLDLDVASGSAALNMDIQNAQGALQALQAGERLDDVLLDRLLVPKGANFSVLVSPASFVEDQAPSEAAVLRLIEVAASLAPFVVVDLPRHWSASMRKLAHIADEFVIVCEPTLLGLRNAKALAEAVRQQRANDTDPSFVLNKKGMRLRKELEAKLFTDTLPARALGMVDHAPAAFSRAENEGRLLIEADPNSAAAQTINAIGLALSGRPARRPEGLFARFARVLRR